MRFNANSWSQIERWLARYHWRQNDLAKLLGVTPSSISQMKSGSLLLNPRQMDKILQALTPSPAEQCAFYNAICQARLFDGTAAEGKYSLQSAREVAAPDDRIWHLVPIWRREDLTAVMGQNVCFPEQCHAQNEYLYSADGGDDRVALLAVDGREEQIFLLLDRGRKPLSGELVCCCGGEGNIALCRYLLDRNHKECWIDVASCLDEFLPREKQWWQVRCSWPVAEIRRVWVTGQSRRWCPDSAE